jgi:lysyl endopeptidase
VTPNSPKKIACPILVNSSFRSISEKTFKNGQIIHCLTIESENLNYLNSFSFSNLNLQNDAKIRIFDAKGKDLTFFSESTNTILNHWLSPKFDSKIINIELIINEQDDSSDFTLRKMNHGCVIPQLPQSFNKSCWISVDVRCSPEGDDWKKEINGVVNLLMDGEDLCSGSIINNTSNDGKPYILTAFHCYDLLNPNSETWNNTLGPLTEIEFNFESPWCQGPNSVDHVYLNGVSVIAHWGPVTIGTDFLLLESINQIPTEYNPYYTGWDRRLYHGIGGVGIHHPMGDVKKISTYSTQPDIISSCVSSMYYNIPWVITNNGNQRTQPGSSGSPLLNNRHRIIGQLFGGCTVDLGTCSSLNGPITGNNRPLNQSKYGILNISWDGNGFANGRLRDWLDPLNLMPVEHFGLRIIRDYYINYNKWVTGDIVKFFNVEVEAGKNVQVLELQDRFQAKGTLKIPVGSTFKVYKP